MDTWLSALLHICALAYFACCAASPRMMRRLIVILSAWADAMDYFAERRRELSEQLNAREGKPLEVRA